MGAGLGTLGGGQQLHGVHGNVAEVAAPDPGLQVELPGLGRGHGVGQQLVPLVTMVPRHPGQHLDQSGVSTGSRASYPPITAHLALGLTGLRCLAELEAADVRAAEADPGPDTRGLAQPRREHRRHEAGRGARQLQRGLGIHVLQQPC